MSESDEPKPKTTSASEPPEAEPTDRTGEPMDATGVEPAGWSSEPTDPIEVEPAGSRRKPMDPSGVEPAVESDPGAAVDSDADSLVEANAEPPVEPEAGPSGSTGGPTIGADPEPNLVVDGGPTVESDVGPEAGSSVTPHPGEVGEEGEELGDYAVGDRAAAPGARLRRRPGRKVAVVAIAVVALLATGLAITQLTASDGSESPEAAVEAFFDAVEDEDALGVLESLVPTERDVLVPSVQELADQLTRFEVADGLDLEKVEGVDIEVEDLELRTQGLHPDVSAVKVTGGTIATSASFRDLPLGTALTAALEEQGRRDLAEPVTGSERLDLTLVTVKSDEGWHVSLLYSLAEAARVRDDAPVPDFGNGIPARGADTPEGAVEAMVAAFNEADVTRMIELTPPDTMAVLHDYGPDLIAVDEGEGEGDDSRSQLEDVTFGEPEGSGDTRRIPLEGYRWVDVYDGAEETVITYDGSCITFDWSESGRDRETVVGGDGEVGEVPEAPNPTAAPPVPQKQCAVGQGGDALFGMRIGGGLPLGPLLFGPGQADLVVVQRDGAWFVDPARSLLDSLLLNLKRASPEQIERMVEYWAAITSGDDDAIYAFLDASYYENCPGVDPPAVDASFEERKEAGLACDREMSDSASSSDSGSADGIAPGSGDAEAQCRATSPDEAALVACLEAAGVPGAAGPTDDPAAADACYDAADDAAIEACLEGLGDPAALRDFRSMSCYDAADDAAIEACLQALGDPFAVGEFHEDACYDSNDDAAIEACLQGLYDKGELDPTILIEFRCSRVYDDMADEELSVADGAYDQCLADVTNELNASGRGPGSVTPTTTG